MKCKKTLVVALWAMFVSFTATAQKSNEQQLEKDANALFKAGEFLKAYPLYSQLLALYPAHADYNYKFGACAIYSDPDKTKAVKFLTIATNKALDDAMAWYYLGKAYHLNYQFKDAIKSYETFMRKADPKISSKTDAQRAIETCIYGSNLLSNIKDIDVISKTDADKNNFFRYFNLEDVGGKILTVPDELKSSMDKKSKETGVMHFAGNGTVIYFSSYGKDGASGKDIYKANVLPDGKFSTPEKIKGDVNSKYDEDYCFMHSDGKTLYFSSKGHNSMGGYDVFKSIYDPTTDSFGPAINMDFAINTPDDDIFYMTDSLNKRAYFASGRSSDLNHLSVYNVMVQSTPLQVVYLKGDFFSEINNEQKSASFKIIDPNSNRIICDANTNSNGAYVLYVPRSGEYTFKVTTENSPTIHEVKVGIPVFDRPVALRQEMRLVSDNGRDKIVIKNHFEEPLEEDLASLAAEMLRKKAGLEANVSADFEANNTEHVPAANAHALEPTMQNAPLAAGFGDGVAVKAVISDMEMELAEIKKFVAESDQKYDNSYAYAMKKQKEADAALAKAESIRKTTGGYTSDGDITKLRESNSYTSQAESLQMEALAAMNAAEAVKQYKSKEAERAQLLEEQVRMLKQSEATQNFDAAVSALKTEKSRKNAKNDGSESTPFSDLMAKAKSKEAELQTAEKALSDMRTREKNLESKVKTAQDKLNSTTKKSEKAAAENDYMTQKAELDNLRKSIVNQNTQIKKLGDETKLAIANVEVYKRLASDTDMGLTATEKKQLSDGEKTTLSMKLGEMKNRISALEITDPQTLAMITDSSMGSVTVAQTVVPKSTSSAPVRNVPAATIKSDKELALKRTGTAPALAPTRKMYVAGSLEQTNSKINALELKKQQGTFNTADNAELAELVKLRSELQTEMASNKTTPVAMTDMEYNAAMTSVIPNYTSDMNAISTSSNGNMNAADEKMDYYNAAIAELKKARINNSVSAMAETDNAKVAEYTKKDQQLEAAILRLETETSGANLYAAAYEKENKAIIESDDLIETKSEKQAQLTESYIAQLDELAAEKQKELDLTTDTNESNEIRMEIGSIKQEQAKASEKLIVYQKNNNAVASSTSTKSSASTAPKPVIKSLEDELEIEDQKLSSNRSSVAQGIPAKTEAEVAKDAMNMEKMFKPRVESESIFAYESGIFEEIVTKHQSDENTLKNREKISELNSQIFLIEGEMENVTSDSKLRKLDYQAEQMYLKRSLIEIDNSPAIARMAAMEYEAQSANAKEMCQANREKIDSRFTIKEEIARLERQSKENMEQAGEMRKLSPSMQDDIERADNDRQAFAKEALAIEQLKQIQDINNNIDMLLSYTDQNLAQLKTGVVPNEYKEGQLVAKNGSASEGTAGTSTESAIASSEGGSVASVSNVTNETLGTSNSALISEEKTTQGGSSSSVSGNTEMSSPTMNASMTAEVKNASSNNASNPASSSNGSNSIAGSQDNMITAEAKSTSSTTDSSTSDPSNSAESRTGSSDNTMTALLSNTKTSNNNDLSSESASMTTQTSGQSKSGSNSGGIDTHSSPKSANTKMVVSNGGNENESVSIIVPVSTSESNTVTAKANSTASGDAMSASAYYFSAPKSLTSDIFSRTNKAIYTNGQPIPIDMEMPSGIYYKVQVGAFRNDIPQNLYDEFAPICGERLDNGITRYTAGFFMNFENADNVKREIRSIGYGDAFVVAFRDGKRIPLYEAMGKTEGESMMAAVEKEYIHGDKGEAPKASIKVTPKPAATSTSNKSSKPKSSKGGNANNNGSIIYTASHTSGGGDVSDYYAGFPEAAKATKVESTKGLFFTVQVGVYSRPVAAKSLHYINPVNSELTESRKIRYTSGIYTSMQDAVDKRAEARALGIADAFVTAYYNGQRISLSEADKLLKEKGNSVLITKGIN